MTSTVVLAFLIGLFTGATIGCLMLALVASPRVNPKISDMPPEVREAYRKEAMGHASNH